MMKPLLNTQTLSFFCEETRSLQGKQLRRTTPQGTQSAQLSTEKWAPTGTGGAWGASGIPEWAVDLKSHHESPPREPNASHTECGPSPGHRNYPAPLLGQEAARALLPEHATQLCGAGVKPHGRHRAPPEGGRRRSGRARDVPRPTNTTR